MRGKTIVHLLRWFAALAMATALAPASAFAPGQWTLPTGLAKLPAADRESILRAAGFKRAGASWKGCDGSSDLTAGEDWIDGGSVRDLNGDTIPEVVVGDEGSACYGMTGQGYTILQWSGAAWKVVDSGAGIPRFLKTRGAGGWQDVEIGGPGFCFPVMRWDGKQYALLRHQYEDKPCRP